MLRLDNFGCVRCLHYFEDLHDSKDESGPPCPKCGWKKTQRFMGAPKVFSTIVPTTKKSKKLKAGYVHTHGDRPKTPGKVQVGYGT